MIILHRTRDASLSPPQQTTTKPSLEQVLAMDISISLGSKAKAVLRCSCITCAWGTVGIAQQHHLQDAGGQGRNRNGIDARRAPSLSIVQKLQQALALEVTKDVGLWHSCCQLCCTKYARSYPNWSHASSLCCEHIKWCVANMKGRLECLSIACSKQCDVSNWTCRVS